MHETLAPKGAAILSDYADADTITLAPMEALCVRSFYMVNSRHTSEETMQGFFEGPLKFRGRLIWVTD